MSFELNAALSLSVGIGAVIGWVRVKKTDPAFLPFLLLLWSGFLIEVASIILMEKGFSNTVLYNVFALFEALVITWQFKQWGLFIKRRKLYYLLQILFLCAWLTDWLSKGSIHHFTSFFIIGYSTMIIFMAIGIINGVTFKEPTPLLINPVFLICMGLIIYFTYTVLTEIFWVYGLNRSSAFRIRVYDIFAYVNLFTNLVFAFATLWIPMKRQYLLQS